MAPVRRGSGAALIEHHLFQQRRPKLSLYTCDFVRRQCQHGLNTFLYPHLCNFLCRSSADFFKRSIHACLLWLLPPPLLLLLLLLLLRLLLLRLLLLRLRQTEKKVRCLHTHERKKNLRWRQSMCSSWRWRPTSWCACGASVSTTTVADRACLCHLATCRPYQPSV